MNTDHQPDARSAAPETTSCLRQVELSASHERVDPLDYADMMPETGHPALWRGNAKTKLLRTKTG
jgi:hypothetical protein